MEDSLHYFPWLLRGCGFWVACSHALTFVHIDVVIFDGSTILARQRHLFLVALEFLAAGTLVLHCPCLRGIPVQLKNTELDARHKKQVYDKGSLLHLTIPSLDLLHLRAKSVVTFYMSSYHRCADVFDSDWDHGMGEGAPERYSSHQEAGRAASQLQ